MRDLVEEPDAVQAGLMEAYGSVAKGSPFEFYVRARDGRGERWIEHTCQLIQEKPLSGGRVAYFVDITPRKSLAPGQQTREAHLRELDQILLTLARRSDSADSEELSVMRQVAELASPAWKRDRWEIWSLSTDRARWTLDHLNYATQRQREESTPEVSVPQTGPYLRKLEQVRVLVTPDIESDPDGSILLGQGRIAPDAASRLDVPIRVSGKVVGAFVIAHHTARPWTSDESGFAASIGDRMSFPARLRRQLERDGPWLDVYVNPSSTGVSVTIQNKTRRKERDSERSLRDSETRFRSVAESLREGLIITDLSDRIVYVNSRITELTGHRPEDLDGKQAHDLLFDTANWKDKGSDSRMKARREKKRTRYDAPLLDKDGKVVSVEVISTPLRDADGAVTGGVDAITAVENPEGLRTASLAT